MREVDKRLAEIQQALKVPKGQWNSFGKYNYRSAEDIQEAAKALLDGALLTISDEVVEVGGRIYVKATATFRYAGEMVETTSYAREQEDKKGMDHAQITGAASSYACKYALKGMFLLDDTKDSDATNKHGNDDQPAADEAPKARKRGVTIQTNVEDFCARLAEIKDPGAVKPILEEMGRLDDAANDEWFTRFVAPFADAVKGILNAVSTQQLGEAVPGYKATFEKAKDKKSQHVLALISAKANERYAELKKSGEGGAA